MQFQTVMTVAPGKERGRAGVAPADGRRREGGQVFRTASLSHSSARASGRPQRAPSKRGAEGGTEEAKPQMKISIVSKVASRLYFRLVYVRSFFPPQNL